MYAKLKDVLFRISLLELELPLCHLKPPFNSDRTCINPIVLQNKIYGMEFAQ